MRPPYSPIAIGLTLTVAGAVLAALAWGQTFPAQTPMPPPAAGTTAFMNVNVVPMDRERVLAQQTVLVKDGRITALGPSNTVKVPANAMQIDGMGKYLIPGLGDCHFRTEGGTAQSLERKLLEFVSAGVTTVQTVTTPESESIVSALRTRGATGELLMPQIYTVGYPWPQPEGSPGDRRPDLPPPSPAEVVAKIAEYKAAGFNAIEFLEQFNTTTPEGAAAWNSLLAAARREGLPIVGRVLMMPQTGVPERFMRHYKDFRAIDGLWAYLPAMRLDEPDSHPEVAASIANLADDLKRAGVWSCPRLFMNYGGLPSSMYQTNTTPSLPPYDVGEEKPREVSDSLWNALTRHSLRNRAIIKKLQETGAGVLAGSEGCCSFYVVFDMRSFVVAGLTPYQALLTSTRNIAEYLGTSASTGTIAVGKQADLVLLNDNPLVEIRNVQQSAGVMLRGRWMPRAELERRVAASKGE